MALSVFVFIAAIGALSDSAKNEGAAGQLSPGSVKISGSSNEAEKSSIRSTSSSSLSQESNSDAKPKVQSSNEESNRVIAQSSSREASSSSAGASAAKATTEPPIVSQSPKEVKATPEPQISQSPKEVKAEAETPESGEVWIPRTGAKYHRSSSCSNMKNPSFVTLEKAVALGFTPCKKCY